MDTYVLKRNMIPVRFSSKGKSKRNSPLTNRIFFFSVYASHDKTLNRSTWSEWTYNGSSSQLDVGTFHNHKGTNDMQVLRLYLSKKQSLQFNETFDRCSSDFCVFCTQP